MHSILQSSRAKDATISYIKEHQRKFLWEPEKTTFKSFKFYKMKSCPWNFTIPVKLEIYFLMLLWEIIVFGVFAENYSYLQPLKSVKKNAIWVELFWYKVFVRCKLKYITQFPDGFHVVPGCRSIIIKIMQNFQQFATFSKRKKSDYYMADYAISFASTSHRKLIVVIF